jgi:uncharacterized protein
MRHLLMVIPFLVIATATLAAPPPAHREEEVTFRSGSITIAGTVSLPSGPGPFPAVVLLSGSGPQNRDSELFGFRPFKIIAESFVQRGIAVLRCDDRGVGGSTGSVADATTEDFAGDALAAVRMLRERAEIDSKRVGLLGHSEGAIVAAIAAARSSDVGFIVWMAGSAVPGSEILRMQADALARAAGASDHAVDEILRHHAAFLRAITDEAPDDEVMALGLKLAAAQFAAAPPAQRPAPGDVAALSERLIHQSLVVLRSPWMRFFIGFDPSTALRRVTCPVFAVFGGRDLQVPEAINRARLEAAFDGSRESAGDRRGLSRSESLVHESGDGSAG